MKYSQAKRVAIAVLKSKDTRGRTQVPFIQGEVGLGKTALAHDICRELYDGNLVYAPVPTMMREDWTGMPDLSGNFATFKQFDWLPNVERDGDKGILLMDELPQADEGTVNGASRLLDELELHGYKLPENWAIIVTGNRQKDRAGCRALPSQVKDRMVTIDVDADVDGWCDWAGKAGISHTVIGFIRHVPDALQEFDPKAEVSPTCRSWSKVSALIPNLESRDYSPAFAGIVGEGRGAEFAGFLRIFDELIPISKIFNDPENCEVPQKPDVRFAVMANIAKRVDESTIDSALIYGERLGRELCSYMVRDLLSQHPDLVETKAICTWRAENADVELG